MTYYYSQIYISLYIKTDITIKQFLENYELQCIDFIFSVSTTFIYRAVNQATLLTFIILQMM